MPEPEIHSLIPLDGDAVEVRYDPGGPIPLSDLAASFNALEAIYAHTDLGDARLSVTSLRSGSIIATIQPFVPLVGQALTTMDVSLTVVEFARRLKAAVDAFSGREDTGETAVSAVIAAELAEVLRPVSGRSNAEFGVAQVRYRSHTKERTVEFEATYSSSEIDRAVVNAQRLESEIAVTKVSDKVEPRPSLLRKVKLSFQQANSGPARRRGKTGDKGVIESESSRALPVYFAATLDDLKDKMVKGAKNPLKVSYLVDAIVAREGGEPRFYTVIGVHGPVRAPRSKSLPLLAAARKARQEE